tara:strand:- start:51 stop:290 length:240 start_codon:yes stop_codon:yes gene_type:complete
MWEFIAGVVLAAAAFLVGWLGQRHKAQAEATQTIGTAQRASAEIKHKTIASIQEVKGAAELANAEQALADLLNKMDVES